MNIFYLAADPYVAASMHCDKHVCKMIIETAQMLSSVQARYGSDNTPYKPTHVKHPSTLWAGDSSSNYRWLVSLGKGLCNEYTRRYGKIHKTQEIIDKLSESPDGLPDVGYTKMPQCMPEEYKTEDSITAYRNYYIADKARFAKWKYTETPAWWPSVTEEA
jgi:hypothetical protein